VNEKLENHWVYSDLYLLHYNIVNINCPRLYKREDKGFASSQSRNLPIIKWTEIENITYLGNDTYMIMANNKNYIAIKKYYSVMNYRWYLYEKINEWG
jgi:hypothetical protein